MRVYWLEQTELDVPVHEDWLSAGEQVCLQSMRFLKRRADWRLGRWTAKMAAARCLAAAGCPLALSEIEIRAAPSGAPELFLSGEPMQFTTSLSHSSGRAVCALTEHPARLGCDLEKIEFRSAAFIADYFTDQEQPVVARTPAEDRAMIATLLWSAKESAMKALRTGLRLDTRDAQVQLFPERPGVHSWQPLRVRIIHGPAFCGSWSRDQEFVRTVVCDPRQLAPIQLPAPEAQTSIETREQPMLVAR